MLLGIPRLLSPDLLKALSEMGHGDYIVIADGNFPGVANNNNIIRMDGHNISEILKAILTVFPLDEGNENCVFVMNTEDNGIVPIWEEYNHIFVDSGYNLEIKKITRDLFYQYSRKAFCIVTTTDLTLYSNLILTKGVITGG